MEGVESADRCNGCRTGWFEGLKCGSPCASRVGGAPSGCEEVVLLVKLDIARGASAHCKQQVFWSPYPLASLRSPPAWHVRGRDGSAALITRRDGALLTQRSTVHRQVDEKSARDMRCLRRCVGLTVGYGAAPVRPSVHVFCCVPCPARTSSASGSVCNRCYSLVRANRITEETDLFWLVKMQSRVDSRLCVLHDDPDECG